MPPRRITAALDQYIKAHFANIQYIGFISHISLRTDEVSEIARRALHGEPTLTKEELFKHASSEGRNTEQLRQYRQIICENMLCRSVDNFLAYISDILRLAFLKKPDALRSGESITFNEVLSHSAMRDLIKYIVDKKVNELSYQGLNSISEHIRARLRMGC
jgi:hypothetical protein